MNGQRQNSGSGLERRSSFCHVFFFWKSNDNMQMSLEGLYRSILFETLKQCPELIPVVFPTQFSRLGMRIPYVEGDFLGPSAIRKAFEILIAKGTFARHRFCFFVDGLDEYNGDSVDHVQLAESLQLWASGNDVKICASSRPYIEYQDAFSDTPDQKIRLHELTRHDIYLFSRQTIERDRHFEQIQDTYLELVNEIVEMSEGVFLWARVVVRSLLAGILRHDTVRALKKKLKVMPRDINELYNQLLDSLEPDDRERAAKMLLLTAHNPFQKPLNSVMYAWIDDLDDPNFPPIDGIKPSAWPSNEDIVHDVRRQVTSLTKGLLEVAPMERPFLRHCDVFEVVQFYHRTVRDFVLENSRLKDIANRFSIPIDQEAYFRLLLAGLTLTDLKYRLEYWNHDILFDSIRFKLIQQELPINLLKGFERIFNNDQYGIDECNIPNGKYFRGNTVSDRASIHELRLSFVHLAAYAGQQEYVFHEISRYPELLNNSGDLHILLSAAMGGRQNLVLALMKRGSSPTDYIRCILRGPQDEFRRSQPLPIWMVLAGRLVENFLSLVSEIDTLSQGLELFLQDERVDASQCLLQIGKPSGGVGQQATVHILSLKQCIQDIRPPNKDGLVALLDRRSGKSYLRGPKDFLSGWFHASKETTNTVVDNDASERIRLYPGCGKDNVDLGSISCGDHSIEFIKFRLF